MYLVFYMSEGENGQAMYHSVSACEEHELENVARDHVNRPKPQKNPSGLIAFYDEQLNINGQNLKYAIELIQQSLKRAIKEFEKAAETEDYSKFLTLE